MEKHKKELWRIIVAILSIIFIVFMWVKNYIATIYSSMPKEQVAPLIITTIIVSLIKVGGIAFVIFFIKWKYLIYMNQKKYRNQSKTNQKPSESKMRNNQKSMI